MRIRSIMQSLAWKARRRLGHIVPYSIQRKVYRLLYPPDSKRPPILTIDLIGTCNLRCPSCPVGNMRATNAKGLMDEQLFRDIVDKASREYQLSGVLLYNWTEPMMHPQLPKFIKYVKDKGLFCIISSNLNLLRDIDSVVEAAPDDIRISLSGFTQEVYGRTHKGGNIERVKKNMKTLSDALKKADNKTTRVHVYYHKYLKNMHELARMKAYTKELGFDWLESWAYYMPLERVHDLVNGTLAEDQKRFVQEEFALPIMDALEAAKAYSNTRCSLLEDQIIIDVHGNTILCCTVYNLEENTLGKFMEMTPQQLQRAKEQHPTCEGCAGSGMHAYFQYHEYPELQETYHKMAEASLRRHQSTPPASLKESSTNTQSAP